ncbi:DNA topoisomerase 1 [Galemys pyrenaicus]|uniref:DNA topoisomerase I n=1 Tax=Galemys pyrenaicus TaxID=202257 RepID=A0A8J6DMC7_GALPY|nr:DNA topoisomerase 1 [Galemys pyrenaicus]
MTPLTYARVQTQGVSTPEGPLLTQPQVSLRNQRQHAVTWEASRACFHGRESGQQRLPCVRLERRLRGLSPVGHSRHSVSVAVAVAAQPSGESRPAVAAACPRLREPPGAPAQAGPDRRVSPAPSPPAALAAPADMSGDHLHNDSQIDADFRLNGECARIQPPTPALGPRPPADHPAPGPSRAEDRHGVPETKSQLLAHRPHCSHRAACGPPFRGPQRPQTAAFPRADNGDPASPAAGPRAAFPGPDSSGESRLVDNSHKHKDKHKDREHRHKEHKKDKEKDREKSKHSNSEHKDSEKKHKDKEKTKHKDGSSEKHKDKHKDRDKEKRKEEKVRASGDAKIKKEKENGFSSPPRIKDEPEDDGYFVPPKEDIKPLKRPRDEDDADYKPKKIKTEDVKKEKKRKLEEEEDGKLKKPKNKDKDKKVPEPDSKKKKPKKEEEQKWKWWEEERYPEGIKWKFLEHKGPVFAPPYEPLPEGVKFYYDGKVIKLSPKAEEVATFFAKMLDHEYTTKEVFRKNFFKDWRKEMTNEEKNIITNLSKCDFTQISQYFKAQSEARKQMSKEEKQKIKEENEKLLKEYGFCIMDSHKERIANFKIEPPGLFRGRGNHPKMGMLKRRIMPEDIIINCSKDAKVPSPPPGHKWKEVRHDNKVTWLVSWTENIQGSIKYIMLNPSSRIKGEKDWQKYETARRLKKCVDKIRNQYREDWKSKEMKVRQRAVALYFIDKLALRAGNEKEEGETADTVGCCSLRVEHINLHPELDGQEYVVEFDFLGKDSIRYYNKVPVEKRVFKNLQLFMENKQPEDDLFDRLNTGILNKHLQDLMEGLTAKVFRTYNASITLQQQLKELTAPDENIPAKILSYNRANRAVAILCNHQRAPPKTFEKSMMNLQSKIDAKKEQLADARRDLKSAKADAKVMKDAKTKKVVESKKKAVQRLEEQLMKLEVQATDREENKQIALGTSKLNYLDPRISVAWCKKWGVPIEKIYNKTQREKFAWAIDMADEDYEF